MEGTETIGLEKIIRDHTFFASLDGEFCKLVCGCAKNVVFPAAHYLFHEGDAADQLIMLRHGRVAIQVASPGRGAITFQTLGEGEILGLSWLIPPYRWAYDAKSLEPIRAISIDAACLRQKCEADHDLGYELMKRLMAVLIQRLQATRMQILDVYGSHA